MKTSPMTKIPAIAAILAAIGPIAFAAQLGINPDMDIAPYFPIWAGYSALAAIGLLALTFIAAGCDLITNGRG